jgi:hypothetical protein
MVILLVTAFMIYRLFKGWRIFNYETAFSLLIILLGMLPIWTKKPENKWKYQHFNFMYWSVIVLYAAFAAEVLTRIPEIPFFGMVGIATGTITIIGGISLRINKAKWGKITGIRISPVYGLIKRPNKGNYQMSNSL